MNSSATKAAEHMGGAIATAPGRLLIVDDETTQMRALCETLALEGYVTCGFDSPRAALEALHADAFDLLLTDLMMPQMDGIELIAAARRIDPAIGAVVMTGNGTIDTAVQAMQGGALDYITKPFRLNVVLSVIARAMDMHRLRRENAALLQLEKSRAEELAAAYRDLESFSYSISHDLRAPLLFVKDFAERLEQDFAPQLGEEGQHLVRVIRDGSRSMDDMVVGLLAFSRASRQQLQLVQLDMAPIVQAVVRETRALYPESKAEVDIVRLPPAAADPTGIRHVWSNLIGNAFKYSARRPLPQIRISGHVAEGEAVYQVQDNGAGFDMRYAQKLFGVFKRLHNSSDFPGTGVGLAIVHRIVTRHGGRVWAESAPDAGACFRFSLPAGLRS